MLPRVHIVKAMVFPELDHKEDQKINAFECGAGEDSWEFLELKGVQPSQS